MARGTWGGLTDPNIFKVTFRWRSGTSHCQMGFKLRDVAVQDNTAQEVADEVSTQLNTAFRFLIRPIDALESIDVIKLGTEEGGVHQFTPAEGAGGDTANAGSWLPEFLCANISLKSEIRKRYGQGRFFLPIAQENYIDTNLLNNAGVTAMNGFVNPLIEHFTGDPATHDLILVNAHPALAQRGTVGVPGYRAAIPASWYDVTAVRVNTLVTSLRSRRVGVGS